MKKVIQNNIVCISLYFLLCFINSADWKHLQSCDNTWDIFRCIYTYMFYTSINLLSLFQFFSLKSNVSPWYIQNQCFLSNAVSWISNMVYNYQNQCFLSYLTQSAGFQTWYIIITVQGMKQYWRYMLYIYTRTKILLVVYTILKPWNVDFIYFQDLNRDTDNPRLQTLIIPGYKHW